MLAIPWYFARVEGGASLFGKTYSLITILSIFWMILGGTLIDRYRRKNIFMLLNLGGFLVLAGAALAGHLLGHTPQGVVLAVFTGTILIYIIHYPSLYAFAQEITPVGDYTRTNSLIEIQGQTTSMFAGGLAAILLSGAQGGHIDVLGKSVPMPLSFTAWSLEAIFTLNAITYLLSFIIIGFIRYTPVVERRIETGDIRQRLKSGWKFLRARKRLALFGNASLAPLVVVLVHEFFLLSVYVQRHLKAGAAVYAACQLCYAFGAVLSGIGIRQLLRFMRIPQGVALLVVTTSIFLFILSFSKSVLITFLFTVVLGICNAGSRILRLTYLFQVVPNDLIGRTNSVFSISHTLYRAFFLYLFALPFFQTEGQVQYAYMIFGAYTLGAAGVVWMLGRGFYWV